LCVICFRSSDALLGFYFVYHSGSALYVYSGVNCYDKSCYYGKMRHVLNHESHYEAL